MPRDDDLMGSTRSSHLVGRDEELSRLRRAADEARRGDARVVVIEGEPGIGKSRLIADLLGDLRQAGDLVVMGHGVNLAGGELAYGVASEVLRDLVHQLGVDVVREALDAHASNLRVLHPAFAEGDDRGPVDRAAVFGAMHAGLLELTRDRLLCLAVDDLHWVDSSSRALFVYLAKVSMYTPLMLVCAVRSTPREEELVAADLAELSRIPGGFTLRLDTLTPDAVAEQVRAMAGTDVSPELVTRVQQVSEGVPLFVEELLAASGDEREMSTRLRVNLAGRMQDLDVDAVRFLQAAAVGAGHAHEAMVAVVCAMDLAAAVRARDDAATRGLLAVSTGTEVRFHHALLREAVLTTLTHSELESWHRCWAHSLEQDPRARSLPELPIVVAQHWYACRDPERALPTAIDAARVSASRGGLAEAAMWWERALGMWDRTDDPEGVTGLSRSILLKEVIRSYHAGGSDTAIRHLVEVCRSELDRPDDGDWLKSLYLRLCSAWHEGLLTGVIRQVMPADKFASTAEALLAEQHHPLAAECVAQLVQRDASQVPGPLRDRVLECVVADAEGSGDLEQQLMTLGWVAFVLLGQGELDRGLEVNRQIVELCRGSRRAMPAAIGNAIGNFMMAGECAEAVEFFDSQVDLASGFPAVLLWANPVSMLTDALYTLGDWDRCLDLLAILEETEPEMFLNGFIHALRARIAALRGDIEVANVHLALMRRSLPEAGAAGASVWASGPATLAEAQVALAVGEPDRAVAALQRGLHVGDLAKDPNDAADLVLLVARCLSPSQEGTIERVEELRRVADQLNRLGRHGAAWSAELEALLGALDGRTTSQEWLVVVERWDALGHGHHALVARVSLAESLLREGDRKAAAVVVEEGLETADQLRAAPLVERLRTLAKSARVRGQSSQTLPLEFGRLTAREVEVLGLVAEGCTNDQIASELFMSPKTASVHVSRIITKLGVTNRTQAADFAHRHGLANKGHR